MSCRPPLPGPSTLENRKGPKSEVVVVVVVVVVCWQKEVVKNSTLKFSVESVMEKKSSERKSHQSYGPTIWDHEKSRFRSCFPTEFAIDYKKFILQMFVIFTK